MFDHTHVTLSFRLTFRIDKDMRFCLRIFIHDLTLRHMHKTLILRTQYGVRSGIQMNQDGSINP